MIDEYFWNGYLASKIVRCHGLEIFQADVKKNDQLMVTFEMNYKQDHSVCVRKLDEQIVGFLVEADASKLYPLLREHVYTGEIEIIAFANTVGDDSLLDVKVKFFTEFYEAGDAKLIEIEQKIHTSFP